MSEEKTIYAKAVTARSEVEVERDHKAFSALLDLAEEVHVRREDLRKQFLLGAGAGVSAILAASAAIAGYVRTIDTGEYLTFREVLTSPLSMVLSTVILFAYFVIILLYSRYRRQMKRETRALHEVMSVVHEVLQSSELSMSPLEKAQVKIRLSRMDN